MNKEFYKKNNKFLQSYVYAEESTYFVSTAYRKSSAIDRSWYFETIVWDFDVEKNKRGHIVEMEGEGEPIKQHYDVVKKLLTNLKDK